MGELEREDRGFLVRRVRRLSGKELEAAITSGLSDVGSATAFPDGLVVVSDQAGVLERISVMLDEVETAGLSTWVVQVHVLSFSQTAAREFGVDTTPAGQLAASIALASGGVSNLDFSLGAELNNVLRAVDERADSFSLADPVLLMADGRESQYNRISRVPYVNNVIETSGNIIQERQSVEFVDVGFKMQASLRELGSDSALLELSIENSDVTRVNDNLPPETSQDNFNSVIPIRAGGVYLVGAFESNEIERSQGIGLVVRNKEETSKRVYQVWLRSFAIDMPQKNVEQIPAPLVPSKGANQFQPIGSTSQK